MAYVLQVEHRERVALALVARGADLDVLEQVRTDFDAALNAPPVPRAPVDRERAELHDALGVSGGR